MSFSSQLIHTVWPHGIYAIVRGFSAHKIHSVPGILFTYTYSNWGWGLIIITGGASKWGVRIYEQVLFMISIPMIDVGGILIHNRIIPARLCPLLKTVILIPFPNKKGPIIKYKK